MGVFKRIGKLPSGLIAFCAIFLFASGIFIGLHYNNSSQGVASIQGSSSAQDAPIAIASTAQGTNSFHGPHPGSEQLVTMNTAGFPDTGGVASSGYGIAAGGGLTGLNQTDLDAYFAMIKSLGITWLRWDIDWAAVQPDNETNYNWQGVDRVAATAARNGINSLGLITNSPRWAQDPNKQCTIDENCPPLDPVVFARFAGIVAARYKNSITAWEIWNEPNLNASRWAGGGAVGYAAFLKAAYTAIRTANPAAGVIAIDHN